MKSTFHLICLSGLCIQISTLIAGQSFFPANEEEFENVHYILEEEYLNEEALIEDANQLEENTPEEIGDAISKNAVRIFNSIGKLQAAEIEDIVDEEKFHPSSQQDLLPIAIALSLGQYSDVVSDVIGNLVADGLVAFKDAQINGEDTGAAVGLVLSTTIRDLNNSAEAIGDAVQQSVNQAIAMAGSSVDEGNFGTSGLVIERLVSSLTDMADDIGQKMAAAINEAVSQGGDAVQMLGMTYRNFVTSLGDDADNIGRRIADALTDSYKGLSLSETDLALLEERTRAQVDDILEDLLRTSDDVEEAIIYIINEVITGARFKKDPAKDTVEVINRFGDFLMGY